MCRAGRSPSPCRRRAISAISEAPGQDQDKQDHDD
jgi:hypothetical protein